MLAMSLPLPAFLFAVESAVRRRAAQPLVTAPELQ
jgi:hypothetical protein